MSERVLEMRVGPMPRLTFALAAMPGDDDGSSPAEANATSSSETAGVPAAPRGDDGSSRPSPSLPAFALPPGTDPVPTPPIEAGPSAVVPPALPPSCPNDPAVSSSAPAPNVEPSESPEIAGLRRNLERLTSKLDAARGSLPGLAGAVHDARQLLRERAIEAKIRDDDESARLAREARDLLARAEEADALAAQELATLEAAHGRVRKALQDAVAAAQRDDERAVRAVILDPANLERVKGQLGGAIDWLHLASHLRGAGTGHVQSLVADAIGQHGGLSGEAMWKRSRALFEKTLAEARAKEGTP